ncbi:hypothetical protein Tco_0351659 [Tanacetum coccineum]
MYPPTTSESSAGDSSSESSARPSHMRCMSPARFREIISPEDSVEENIDTDVLEDIEADVTAVEVAVDKDVEAGIDTGIGMEVDVGVDVEDEVEDEVESSDKVTMEVRVDVVAKIDIPDAMLMLDDVECLEQVEEGLQDIYDHISSSAMSCAVEHDYHSLWYDPEAIKELINRQVEEALAAYEAIRTANALEAQT